MNENKNNTIIILLIIVIAILSTLLILTMTGTLNLNNKETNKNLNNTQNNEVMTEEKTSQEIIDINKLNYNNKDISQATTEEFYINGVDGNNYSYTISLLLSGKLKIGTYNNNIANDDYISNVNNIIDIIKYSIPGQPEEQLIYMLDNNGDVYYYRVGDSIEKKYTATKVDNVSNVKKLFLYSASKPNAGARWELVAITNENECIMIKSEGV